MSLADGRAFIDRWGILRANYFRCEVKTSIKGKVGGKASIVTLQNTAR